MININELKVNIDLLINNNNVGNIDIKVFNSILYITRIKKADTMLSINNFIDLLLEETSNLKKQFKCKKVSFGLLEEPNNTSITKSDILNYITNQYY